MEQPLKILLLEDNKTDAEMIQRFLLKKEKPIEFMHAENKSAFLQALDEFQPQLILSDHTLPQFNSAEALKIARDRFPDIPFIMITGTVSEEFAVEIIKSGADDYLLKDRLNRLPLAIDNALEQRKIKKEKQAALNKLIESEEKYRTIFLKSPLPKWIYDTETLRFLEVNEAAVVQYGYSVQEFMSMTIKDIRPAEDVDMLSDDLKEIETNSGTRQSNWRHLKKNGELMIVETTAHSIDYNNREARMVVVNDITEKMAAIEELRKSEFRLNKAQVIGHISNWELDLVNNVDTWSDEFFRIYGLTKSEYKPSSTLFLSLMHPDDADFANRKMQEAFKTFNNSSFNFRFIRKDGAIRYGYTEWKFEFDANRKPLRLFGIVQDITESKEAEQELKKSFDEKQALALRMSIILNTLPANIALLDEKGCIIDVNDAWRNLADSNGFIGSNYGVGDNYLAISGASFCNDETIGKIVADGIQNVIANNAKEFVYEYPCHTPHKKIWFRMVASPLQEKEYAGAVVMHIDISELRRLEDERLENKKEELNRTTRAMLVGQEKERNAIGVELHDNVNQILVGTNLVLTMLRNSPARVSELIPDCIANIRNAINENRKIAHELVTPDLANETLLEQLIRLSENMLKTGGLQTDIHHEDFSEYLLTRDQKLAIYRVAQEQCTNIIKYSHAKAAMFLLYTAGNSFTMRISDDGVGMNDDKAVKGIGLRNISSRIGVLGGTVNIDTAPGKGFALEIEMPIG